MWVRRMRTTALGIACSMALCALPGPARADGMMVTQATSTQTVVRAFAQRALLWQRSGTWELYLQALFEREEGQVAWIVPFPVRPTVHEASADLLDQLDLLTAPIFQTRCYDDSERSVGCMGAATDGSKGGGPASSTEASVKVWAKGTVGQLDYVILSASDGDDLAAWISAHGYRLPEGAAATLGALDTEGQFYFVAQPAPDADPTSPMVVRFELPGVSSPLYPLRLTSTMVGPGETLDLELFVAMPNDRVYLPGSDHPANTLASDDTRDASQYERAREAFFSQTASNHVLLTFFSTLPETNESPRNAARCQYEYSYECALLSELGVPLPTQWADEIVEMITNRDRVLRLEGRLDAQAMAADLVLEPSDENFYDHQLSAFYIEWTGSCPVEPDSHVEECSAAGRAPTLPEWFALLLAALAWLAGVRLTRRIRRARR